MFWKIHSLFSRRVYKPNRGHHWGSPLGKNRYSIITNSPCVSPCLHEVQASHSLQMLAMTIRRQGGTVKDRTFFSSHKDRIVSKINWISFLGVLLPQSLHRLRAPFRIKLVAEGTMMLNPRRWATPCHTWAANGHWSVRWSRVSSCTPQSKQSTSACRPCRRSWSTVQQHRQRASQAWNFTLKGAKGCHTCVAPGSAAVMWKNHSWFHCSFLYQFSYDDQVHSDLVQEREQTWKGYQTNLVGCGTGWRTSNWSLERLKQKVIVRWHEGSTRHIWGCLIEVENHKHFFPRIHRGRCTIL
jgi:hypothetical protein